MDAIKAWYRKQIYYWYRDEYFRWCNWCLYMVLGVIAVGIGGSWLVQTYLYPALDMGDCGVVVAYLAGIPFGGAFTLMIVDRYEKKLAGKRKA